MYVRQVKRKCNVRGCKNTECFAISRTREVGNTVIICKSCLNSALKGLSEISPKTKSNIPVIENKAIPNLFFNAAALGKEEAKKGLTTDVAALDEKLTATEEQNVPEEKLEEYAGGDLSTEVFACPECGKEFDSMRGLQTHTRYCKPQNEE